MDQPDGAQTDAETATITSESVTVRRSPRYYRFMFAGAAVFAVIALILTFSFPAQPGYDRSQILGFLLLVAVVAGVAVGAVAALVIERATARMGRVLLADRLDVHANPVAADPGEPRRQRQPAPQPAAAEPAGPSEASDIHDPSSNPIDT